MGQEIKGNKILDQDDMSSESNLSDFRRGIMTPEGKKLRFDVIAEEYDDNLPKTKGSGFGVSAF